MMEAGGELDALVAEKVMGWQWQQWAPNPEQPHLAPPGYGRPHPDHWWLGRSIFELVPHYSTDIADAWLIVEHLHGRVVIDHWSGNQYKVMIYIPSSGSPSVEASADTAPLALCLAALAAVGVEC